MIQYPYGNVFYEHSLDMVTLLLRMNVPDKIQKFIKTVAGIILSGVFIGWTIKTFMKYLDEPTSTTITYQSGDLPDGAGIIFPQITICDFLFARNNPILNKCSNGNKDFMTAMELCLKNDPDFKIEAFNDTLQTDHKLFIQNLTLKYGALWSFNLDHLDKIVWSNVYHRRFGLCYNLDLTRSSNHSVSHNLDKN